MYNQRKLCRAINTWLMSLPRTFQLNILMAVGHANPQLLQIELQFEWFQLFSLISSLPYSICIYVEIDYMSLFQLQQLCGGSKSISFCGLDLALMSHKLAFFYQLTPFLYALRCLHFRLLTFILFFWAGKFLCQAHHILLHLY